jgi:hypothetical protein
MNQLYTDLCKVKALLVAGWGQDVGRDDTRLCPIDALGLIMGDQNRLDVSKALYDELERTVGNDLIGLVDWNDDPSRTKAEVIDLVQRAADRASAEC